MAEDGTLTVTLYSRGGISGQLQKTYNKGDPKADKYLKHIGGLEPGEEKLIPPFGEPIDDARAEAAVKAHIANEPWAADAKPAIVGTDKAGNIAVTVYVNKKARLQIMLDPKTYGVVETKQLDR